MAVLIFLVISLILGPLGQIPLGIPDVRLYVSDLLAFGVLILALNDFSKYSTLIYRDKVSQFFFLFVGIASISLLATPLSLPVRQWAISGLYLIRLGAYFCVYLYLRHVTAIRKIKTGSIYKGLMWDVAE